MRFNVLVASIVLTALAAPAIAQENYIEFSSKEDRFTITFPGTPTMSETTWVSEYGVVLPAKVYTVNGITGHHTLTVVDYRPIERVLTEKARSCPLGAETCQGVTDTGLGYWKNDVRGAVIHGVEGGFAILAVVTRFVIAP